MYLILDHLIKFLLEVVLQFLALVRNFPIFLEELAEVLKLEFGIVAPLIEEEIHSLADELILAGVVLGWEELVVGGIDELVGLFVLEVVGEGFDDFSIKFTTIY